MSEEQYWFENIPEKDRFYCIVQWGVPPSKEEEAKQQEEEEAAAPRNKSVFDSTLQEVEESKKRRQRAKKIRQRAEEVGFAMNALSPPWWTEAQFKWVHDPEGHEYLEAPRLYTTKEAAEAVLRDYYANEPEDFMLVETYGVEEASEALGNTAPMRAAWMDREFLLEALEDVDFLCVMVDDQLMLRREFMKKLGEN